MNPQSAKVLAFAVGGLLLASPLIAVAVFMAAMGVRFVMVAPSLAWTLWAIPIAGAAGVLLIAYGVWTLLRGRSTTRSK
jgi:hypothetical protein